MLNKLNNFLSTIIAFGFQRLACITGDSAAFFCCRAVVGKALRILAPRDFSGASLAQHRKDQLRIDHVIAQVVAGLYLVQPLDSAECIGRDAEGSTGDLGGEDGIFPAFWLHI